MRVRVPGDRAVVVYHAPAGNRRAIVYLHGVCGDVFAVRSWAPAVSLQGTLIAMMGDDACKGRPGRFRWGRSPERMHERVQAAIAAVGKARGGQLDSDRATVIGYSQGATRAEQLVSRYPEVYPRVLLGSPPEPPHADMLTGLEAVAVVSGAREDNAKRRGAAHVMASEGRAVTYLELPAACHGDFGPEASRVMGDAVAWLFEKAP